MKRRDVLRWLGLGLLASGVGALVLRRPSPRAGETCVSQGVCRGCAAYRGCGRPTALSMKQALGDEVPR